MRLMAVLLCLGFVAAAPWPALAQLEEAPRPAEVTGARAAQVDSVGILAQAVAKDSTDFDSLYRLGVLYMDRDYVIEAVKVLTKAHVLRPKDHRVAVNLGAALDAGGRANQAQAYYREALELMPGDSVASCRLASSLYAQGNHAEAIDLLREVIARSPRAYCAYFTLGVAFADAGIYRDAIRMWEKVVELAPTSPEAVSARESIEVLKQFVAR
jgi:Flp pilus assembly protein TadD